MSIRVTMVIEDFDDLKDRCWGGAVSVLEKVEEKGMEDELMDLLEQFDFESETDLNDFIHFDLENWEPFDRLWDDD